MIITSSLVVVTDDVVVSVPVSVDLGPDQNLCIGDPDVVLDATVASGSATYQWQLNNADISGATSSSYTSANLANLDVVRLLVSTSLGCIANPIFTSSGIEISVNSSSTNSTSQTILRTSSKAFFPPLKISSSAP